MSLFKRRRSESSGDPDGPGDAVDAVDDTATGAGGGADEPDGEARDSDGPGIDAGDPATAASPDRAATTSGPYDVDDAPERPRLDLGALQLPLLEGAEVQLQVDEPSGLVTAAMVVLGESAVQLQAFAAPRSEGIWGEVSEEIAGGISQQGGTVDPSDGPFGRELLGRVPAAQPDGKVAFQPMRFVGVDGPRWLLRAVFHGRSAIEPAAAEQLENLVRDVVVVRGVEPMGPRELLGLQLPEGATQVDPGTDGPGTDEAGTDEAGSEDQPRSTDDLNPFERGPEITEIR